MLVLPLLLPATSLSRERLHLALIIHLGRCRTSQCQEITGKADKQIFYFPFLYNWSSLESEFIANFLRIQRSPPQQSLAVAHVGELGWEMEEQPPPQLTLFNFMRNWGDFGIKKVNLRDDWKAPTEWQLWESVAGTWYSSCAVDRRVRSLELWVTGD